jgi:hypothetical protein
MAWRSRRQLTNVLSHLRRHVTTAVLEAGNATLRWASKTARRFLKPGHVTTAIPTAVEASILTQ